MGVGPPIEPGPPGGQPCPPGYKRIGKKCYPLGSTGLPRGKLADLVEAICECCGSSSSGASSGGSSDGGGGGFGDGSCCNCLRTTYPTQLLASISSSCPGFGTRTIPIIGGNGGLPVDGPCPGGFGWVGVYSSGDPVAFNVTLCTGNRGIQTALSDEYLEVEVRCVACFTESVLTGYYWITRYRWEKIIGGQWNSLMSGAGQPMQPRLLNHISCDPLVFSESGMTICSPFGGVNPGTRPPNCPNGLIVSINPVSRMTTCVGASINLDISE